MISVAGIGNQCSFHIMRYLWSQVIIHNLKRKNEWEVNKEQYLLPIDTETLCLYCCHGQAFFWRDTD